MNEVLIAPHISEKAMTGISQGCYVFKIVPKANKAQVAKAVARLYKVEVKKVNILNYKNENVLTRGRFRGVRRGWKKALVTLKKGQKIPGFEAK